MLDANFSYSWGTRLRVALSVLFLFASVGAQWVIATRPDLAEYRTLSYQTSLSAVFSIALAFLVIPGARRTGSAALLMAAKRQREWDVSVEPGEVGPAFTFDGELPHKVLVSAATRPELLSVRAQVFRERTSMGEPVVEVHRESASERVEEGVGRAQRSMAVLLGRRRLDDDWDIGLDLTYIFWAEGTTTEQNRQLDDLDRLSQRYPNRRIVVLTTTPASDLKTTRWPVLPVEDTGPARAQIASSTMGHELMERATADEPVPLVDFDRMCGSWRPVVQLAARMSLYSGLASAVALGIVALISVVRGDEGGLSLASYVLACIGLALKLGVFVVAVGRVSWPPPHDTQPGHRLVEAVIVTILLWVVPFPAYIFGGIANESPLRWTQLLMSGHDDLLRAAAFGTIYFLLITRNSFADSPRALTSPLLRPEFLGLFIATWFLVGTEPLLILVGVVIWRLSLRLSDLTSELLILGGLSLDPPLN